MKIRKATQSDVPYIVQMLADDELGASRENYAEPLPLSYYNAFQLIDNDENQHLIVVEDASEVIIGTLQLTFIPYLTYTGRKRAQVEAVRVRKDHRGNKTGEKMLLWAIEKARTENAHVIQLTSDKKRKSALQFYERLGFQTTHEGMKLHFN